MGPAYKVYYFNSRGRAEVIRVLLAQAGVEFEDIRYTREEWAEKGKAAAPLGMAPYIEVDGKKLGQSMACARYIAKEYGMLGSSAWEEAEVNQVADTVEDLVGQLIKIHYGKTDDDKNAGKEKVPVYLKQLETLLSRNGDGKGYFVGDKVSLADIVVLCVLEIVFKLVPECEAAVPALAAHSALVAALPNIAAWIQKRPVTDM